MMFYIIVFVGIILDLASKKLASEFLLERYDIVSDLVYLSYAENTGIAFSMHVPGYILKPLTILLIIFIYCYYKKDRKNISEGKTKKIYDIGFGLIIAGAIGNAIERVFYGRVVDFIGVKYFSIFNLADSLISIGVVIIIYLIYKNALTKKN